jgi:hypothetical protein
MNGSTIVTAPITAAATAFATFVASLDVENNWLPSVAVDWFTGQTIPGSTVPQTDTHCSAFAASVAERVGIYLLQPPDHNPSPQNQEGQNYLANAQIFWLNDLYNPADPTDPSEFDIQINPGVVTAPEAGWANVATRLADGASAYDLAVQAQDLANAGLLVVACIVGNQGYTGAPGEPPPGGPGHIAVIMPADLSQVDLTDRGPAETQAGEVNYRMTHILRGFEGHIPPPPTSPLDSVGVSLSYENPVIQFFYNTNLIKIPVGTDSGGTSSA